MSPAMSTMRHFDREKLVLPWKGFLYYRGEGDIFSNPESAYKVVLAMKTSLRVSNLDEDGVKCCLGLLFNCAVDKAYLRHQYGDQFWTTVARDVPWVNDFPEITDQILQELTSYLIKARLRFDDHNPPGLPCSVPAMFINMLVENMQEAGMGRYIPVLEKTKHKLAFNKDMTVRIVEDHVPAKASAISANPEQNQAGPSRINKSTGTNVARKPRAKGSKAKPAPTTAKIAVPAADKTATTGQASEKATPGGSAISKDGKAKKAADDEHPTLAAATQAKPTKGATTATSLSQTTASLASAIHTAATTTASAAPSTQKIPAGSTASKRKVVNNTNPSDHVHDQASHQHTKRQRIPSGQYVSTTSEPTATNETSKGQQLVGKASSWCIPEHLRCHLHQG